MQAFQKAAQLAVLALLPCVGGLSQAQILGAQPAPPADAGAPAVAASVAQNHLLKGTYINTNRPTTSTNLASGIVPIDALTTVTCPGTTGTCTIEFDQLVQIGGRHRQQRIPTLSVAGRQLPGAGLLRNGNGSLRGSPYLCLVFADGLRSCSGDASGTFVN